MYLYAPLKVKSINENIWGMGEIHLGLAIMALEDVMLFKCQLGYIKQFPMCP